MAAADRSGILTSVPAAVPGPLSRGERLLVHACTFLIGSLNLLLISLDRWPARLWCLAIIAFWAVILMVHSVVWLAWTRGSLHRWQPRLR